MCVAVHDWTHDDTSTNLRPYPGTSRGTKLDVWTSEAQEGASLNERNGYAGTQVPRNVTYRYQYISHSSAR